MVYTYDASLASKSFKAAMVEQPSTLWLSKQEGYS